MQPATCRHRVVRTLFAKMSAALAVCKLVSMDKLGIRSVPRLVAGTDQCAAVFETFLLQQLTFDVADPLYMSTKYYKVVMDDAAAKNPSRNGGRYNQLAISKSMPVFQLLE